MVTGALLGLAPEPRSGEQKPTTGDRTAGTAAVAIDRAERCTADECQLLSSSSISRRNVKIASRQSSDVKIGADRGKP